MMLSVWAPLAKHSVVVECAGQRLPMQCDDRHMWRIDCEVALLNQGYRYSVDGASAVPDPRSRWQPNGVHGASYAVDESALKSLSGPPFRPKPLAKAIIYELHVGTFTPEGTYAAALGKLPHLMMLGVTHIELMPLATFPGNHGWGYDGVFLFAPHPAYGTPEELAGFIAACHSQGLAVLLDVVYNHLGPDGNYLRHFAPYFTDRVKTPWGEAVNFDAAHSDGVRDFVVDNARMWLDVYGFDGLRLDAVHAMSSFEAVHILEDLALAVRDLERSTGRSLTLIAESDLNDPHLVYTPERGGYGLSAHWADDFHHALHRSFTGENNGYYMDFNGIEDLAIAIRDGYVYQGRYSAHRQRRHGRVPLAVRPDQLVISAQNHDQIGNRAQGERLSMLLNPSQLKAVAALTILSPFVPLLFQGEEWGAHTPFLYFTDHQDAKLGELVAEGRRNEFASFGWHVEVPNPQSRQTFERSKLNWQELSATDSQQLLNWYEQLIELRASDTHRASGKAAVEFDSDAQWLKMVYGDICLTVNFSRQENLIPVSANWQLLLSSLPDADAAPALRMHETRVFVRRR